jgi:hypothetical protein
MEQGYIISKTNLSGKAEYLDMVFKDYSESRKIAKKIVNRRNKKIIYQNSSNSISDKLSLMREFSPDFWVCTEEIVKIEVIKVKEFINKSSINTDLLVKYAAELETIGELV